MFIIKTTERRQSCRSGVHIVNFEHISHFYSVHIVDFEQINVGWDVLDLYYNVFYFYKC